MHVANDISNDLLRLKEDIQKTVTKEDAADEIDMSIVLTIAFCDLNIVVD